MSSEPHNLESRVGLSCGLFKHSKHFEAAFGFAFGFLSSPLPLLFTVFFALLLPPFFFLRIEGLEAIEALAAWDGLAPFSTFSTSSTNSWTVSLASSSSAFRQAAHKRDTGALEYLSVLDDLWAAKSDDEQLAGCEQYH